MSPADAALLGASIRETVGAAGTLESAAGALCEQLRRELCAARGEMACVLVRSYVTLPYGVLPDDLQRFAKRAYGAVAITPPHADLRCLVLLGTAGDEPDWNDRRRSRGHQAIPLPTPQIVERAPMIAQLIRELGLDVAQVVRHAPGLVASAASTRSGVFHVERAEGSPYIPAQADFVLRYGVRSVLGFGGLQSSGALFATILFSKVPIPADVADGFRQVAEDVLHAADGLAGTVFDHRPEA